MNKALKCPFCGGQCKLWETDFGVVRVVECETCKIRIVFPWNITNTEIFDFWNRIPKKSKEVKEYAPLEH